MDIEKLKKEIEQKEVELASLQVKLKQWNKVTPFTVSISDGFCEYKYRLSVGGDYSIDNILSNLCASLNCDSELIEQVK